jgi:hypothetical protein
VKKTFLNIIGSLASCFFSSRLATLLSFCTLINTLLRVCVVWRFNTASLQTIGLLRYTFSNHELWNRRIVDVSTGFNTLSIGFGIVSGLFLILKVFIKAIFLLGDNIVAHTLWYSFVQRNLFYLSLKLMAVLYNLYLNSFNLLTLTILRWKCFLFARSNLRKFASFSDIASGFVGQWSHRPLTLATLLEEIATCGALYSFLCSCYQRSGDWR